jgi:Zn-dependent peptidase ImmA (M78 family)
MFAHGFKAKANRIAVAVRVDLQLPPEAPLDPWRVCSYFDIEVIPLSRHGALANHFLNHDRGAFSAVTVVRGGRRAIVHNDKHALARQRSNLMHEVAHSLLGHKATPPLTGNGERNFDGGIEAEAHFLGGALLITNEGAWHIVRSGLIEGALAMYGVSQSMLQYRLRVSGAAKRAAHIERRYTIGHLLGP